MKKQNNPKQHNTYNNNLKPVSHTEAQDNRYVANIMLLILGALTICYVLTELGVFYVPLHLMRISLIPIFSFAVLLEILGRIPSFACRKHTKYYIVAISIIITLFLTTLFNFHAILSLCFPLIIVINYHSTKTSLIAFFGMVLCAFLSPILGFLFGTWDQSYFDFLSWCVSGNTENKIINPALVELGPLKCIKLFVSFPQTIFAIVFGIVIFFTNRRKQHAYKQQIESLRDSRDAILEGMADIVENRDNNTGGHIKRTSDVVEMLILELCENIPDSENIRNTITESFCENVIKAALLHDLGKIAIPDNILTKPERLSPEEFEYIKIHPKKGFSLVRTVLKGTQDEHLLKVAENIALYHHEKIDGSGYPNGLKGEDIPLEARIMAIADVYDALVSKRCYKTEMSHEEAYATIKSSMGSHFDPNLWECFNAAYPKIVEYYS